MRHLLRACAGGLVLAVGATACGGSHNSVTPTPHVTTSPTTTTTATGTSSALWVANGTNVLEFTYAQLAGGVVDAAPHVTLNSPVFGAPQGVQFDAKGDLWVIDGGTTSAGGAVAPGLYEFTPSQLAALHTSSSVMPAIAIHWSGFKFPQQAVFDYKAGWMWVTDDGANEVDVFNTAQLASGGTIAPYTQIKAATPFSGPLGIAFDATNDLYVSNNVTNTIFGFYAATLPASGGTVTLTPNVVLSSNGHSIEGPWGLAFDSHGNLWSSNANPTYSVVEFSKAYISATGTPAPAITLSNATVSGYNTLVSPNGIAFDGYGDLAAVSSLSPYGVADYKSTQLTSGGAIAPYSFLVGTTTTLNAPAGDTFGPSY